MNIPKILFIGNVKLFLNTITHVHVSIFFPCNGVNIAGSIRLMVINDIIKKFIGLNHLIKLVFREKIAYFL